jgi:hypothetical protein
MPFIIINPLPLPILKKFFFLLFFHKMKTIVNFGHLKL